MSKLQRQILTTAQSLAAEELRNHTAFAPYWDSISIVLSGSAVTEYVDEFSGVDLLVLSDDDIVSALRRQLAGSEKRPAAEEFIPVQLVSRRIKAGFVSFSEADRMLARYDDFALAAFLRAPVLHDPGGRFAQMVAAVKPVPREVWERKIADRYRKLRDRQAGLAWNLRRGQPYALLENLTRFLAHSLAICFYVHGQPPTGRKWIFQGALRLDAGRKLRPHLFNLFSTLCDLAMLGGSLNIRQNRIYKQVTAIHDELVQIVADAGFQLQARDDDGSAP